MGLDEPDFWRTLIPLFRPHPEIDRGWALEQKWAVVNGLSPEPACASCSAITKPPCAGNDHFNFSTPLENDTYLSDWAAQGTKLPALIFNSMLVERGQHVVFSTTRFPGKDDARGIANFYNLYPYIGKPFDVRINTAARLSASFPYVAPASRPNLNTPYAGDFHFVDGGYYDNLGIDALIGWLSAAYERKPALKTEIPELLILQIRHFNPAALPRGSRTGWGFQVIAPIEALLSMWNNAPIHRDQNELNLFIDNLAHAKPGLAIKTVTIPYCGLDYRAGKDVQAFETCIAAAGGQPLNPSRKLASKSISANPSTNNQIDCADQPLSWKLSEDQKGCIDDTWKTLDERDPNGALATLKEFLYGHG